LTRFRDFHIVVALALAAGCTQAISTDEYDAGDARKTLVGALDAWKQGRAGQLMKRQPPIRFVDDDWQGGWQLLDYQVGESTRLFGPFKDVPVTLTVRDRSGRTIGKRVTYQVALEPALAVLRSD
jgi:hypothetical protein